LRPDSYPLDAFQALALFGKVPPRVPVDIFVEKYLEAVSEIGRSSRSP
jgi:hypothetical protein